MSFSRVLPDPDYPIDASGQLDLEKEAPGIVSCSLSTTFKFQREDTIGGRTILKVKERPNWAISMKYNPLTKEQFLPVYSFLMEKKGSKKSFYVSLPQYKGPKDFDNFETFNASYVIDVSSAVDANKSMMEVGSSGWNGGYSWLPKIGDMFNIVDSSDSLHTQAYMVTKVETYDEYENQPATSSRINLHFTPSLARQVPAGALINFDAPLFRVKQIKDIQEYSLDTEDLYEFSVQFEETA